MNAKGVNRLFLSMLMIEIAVLVWLFFFGENITFGVVPGLVLSQLIMVIPAICFLFYARVDWKETLSLKKLKISTILMIIVLTYLTMPLVTVINALTMLFSDNVVANMQESILQQPFLVMYFMMAVFGPFCEEFVFRGIVCGGYRKATSAFYSILLSSIIFGIIHMNFNQAPYAFVIGVILATLKEVTGSFFAPLIYHIIFNGHTVMLLYISQKMLPNFSEAMDMSVTPDQLLVSICVYAVIAVVTTALAACVLVWISSNEKGKTSLQNIWKERNIGKGKPVTISFVSAVILCLILMVATF